MKSGFWQFCQLVLRDFGRKIPRDCQNDVLTDCQIGAGLNDCYQLRSGHSTDWKNDIVTGRGRPIAVIRDKRPAIRHEVVRRYSPVPA